MEEVFQVVGFNGLFKVAIARLRKKSAAVGFRLRWNNFGSLSLRTSWCPIRNAGCYAPGNCFATCFKLENFDSWIQSLVFGKGKYDILCILTLCILLRLVVQWRSFR